MGHTSFDWKAFNHAPTVTEQVLLVTEHAHLLRGDRAALDKFLAEPQAKVLFTPAFARLLSGAIWASVELERIASAAGKEHRAKQENPKGEHRS